MTQLIMLSAAIDISSRQGRCLGGLLVVLLFLRILVRLVGRRPRRVVSRVPGVGPEMDSHITLQICI